MSLIYSWISPKVARLILLPFAAALLLAAGEVSPQSQDRPMMDAGPTISDEMLAPMSAEAAAAARAELAAATPADIAAAARAAAPTTAIDFPADHDEVTFSGNRGMRLASLVDSVDVDASRDRELNCLATAVYFESRGEPLEGQLAVAQAIVNRSESGRYPSSLCGVISQPGQFSYDRTRTPRAGSDWRVAQAIAKIAVDDMWHEVAGGAMSFHATHVSPGWRKARVATIGRHIFYR